MSGPLETLAPTRASQDTVPAAYHAHPLLDPHLPRHNPAVARLWVDAWRRLSADDRTYLPLDEVLREADIVTLHVPLTRAGQFPTFHMADR